MKISKPTDFYAPHLIFDPVRKDALIIHFDEVISLLGPYATYAEANAAMQKALAEPRPALRQN